MHSHTSLEALGWDEHFEHNWNSDSREGLIPARVAAEHRGGYVVATADGDLRAELPGRLLHAAAARADLPAVGDWVALRRLPGEDRGLVEAVLPRRTKFSRKAAWHETEEQIVAANVDVVFLVSALGGDLSVRRLERYLALAWESGATPVVVLNKSDLCEDLGAALLEVGSVAFGVPVVITSGTTGEGVEELLPYVDPNRTAVFLGSSGVGKSTLVNRLLGEERFATNEVRADGRRGRHTTTHRELVQLPGGGLLLDTPGMRELQLWDASEGMDSTFADIAELAAGCRFNDCSHRHEPGCAVLQAVFEGTLSPDRLASYRKLLRELRSLEIRQDKRAAAEERRKWALLNREARARARLR